MDLGLAGKTAVVPGASKGTGLAVVRALTAEGVEVMARARHFDGLPAADFVIDGGLVNTS
jgi:NADP-dependent 3-hydroxy acid dehydrogenase YdfG